MNSKKNLLSLSNESAFTLAETLAATAIMLLVLTGVLSVYVMSLNLSDIETMRAKELDKGSLVMEKILRGINGNDGLRDAVSFTITSPSDITYTSLDGQSRRFYLSGNNIYFGPSDVIVGGDIGALSFIKTADCIDVSITFSKTHRGKIYSFKLSESVYPRN